MTEAKTRRPRAVVIDTNLWNKGRLDADQLSKLAARLERQHIEVWVPGQIILEWARHAADDIALVTPALNRLEKSQLRTAATPLPPNDASKIAKTLRRYVSALPNTKILTMRGDSARQGIRDQILGTGPGEKPRNGARTGAVDSAWIRDALAAAGGDPGALIFLTNDTGDLYALTRSLGYPDEDVTVQNQKTVYAHLASLAPPSDPKSPTSQPAPAPGAQNAFVLLAQYFLEMQRQAFEPYDPHSAPMSSWLPVSDIDISTPDDWAAEEPPIEITDTSLAPTCELVGLWNVEVLDEESATATLEFSVVLQGDIDVTGYELDNDGVIQMRNTSVSDALIVVPYLVDVTDGQIGELEQLGPATATDYPLHFRDGDDAFQWFVDQLEAFSGIKWDEEADWFEQDSVVLLGQNGRSAEVQVTGNRYDEWTATFMVGDTEWNVMCLHDPGARAALGRRDSFDVYPPYYFSTDSSQRHRRGNIVEVSRALWTYLVAAS